MITRRCTSHQTKSLSAVSGINEHALYTQSIHMQLVCISIFVIFMDHHAVHRSAGLAPVGTQLTATSDPRTTPPSTKPLSASNHRSAGLAPADAQLTATSDRRPATPGTKPLSASNPPFRRARPGGRTIDSYKLSANSAPAPNRSPKLSTVPPGSTRINENAPAPQWRSLWPEHHRP